MSDGPPLEESVLPSFARADDYKRMHSDIVRTRIGNGDLTLIFSKLTHDPNFDVSGNIIMEQAEVIITWTHMKLLASLLNSLTQAVEIEIGPIPVPAQFFAADATQLDRQRAAVRSMGLATSPPAETVEDAPKPRARRNPRRPGTPGAD